MSDSAENAIKSLFPIRPIVDYSYGLAIMDMLLQTSGADLLQVIVLLHNASDGPIQYQVDKLELRMDGCIASSADKPIYKPTIVARGLNSFCPCPQLKRISANPIPSMSGHLKLDAKYGHPDGGATRMASWEAKVNVVIAPPQPRIFSEILNHAEKSLMETLHS